MGKVFVVEDQDSILEMMMESLSLLDYPAFSATDYNTALALGESRKEEIGVLMCDMVLGRYRGPDLVKELRKIVPDCPVIYTSGYAPEDILPDTSLLESGLFLPKPFSLDKLQEVLEKAMEQKKTAGL